MFLLFMFNKKLFFKQFIFIIVYMAAVKTNIYHNFEEILILK